MDHSFQEAGSSDAPSLALHRLRFLDWSPSTITSLAISPVQTSSTNSASKSRGILAVGRQNGDVELCLWLENKAAQKEELLERAHQTYAKGWVVHTVLPGQLNSKIEQLAFANPPNQDDNGAHALRLFSISGGAIVTEHFLPADLAKLGAKSDSHDSGSSARIGSLSTLFPSRLSKQDGPAPGEIRIVPSLGGAVWSMAASPTGRYLAIGCEDGHARIIDLTDNKFEHLANASGPERLITPRFGKAQGRVISLAWGPPQKKLSSAAKPKQAASDESGSDSDSDSDDEEEESSWTESFLVGGLGNSSAAVWDVATGKIVNKLTVQKARGESTIVWSVATLADGTVVTGDSTGRVTLFDSKTRVPIPGATFRAHASGADVLSLCIGPDGKTIYSTGVDQKVAEYAQISSSSSKKGRWVQMAARRLHAHDIRSLAIDPPYDPIAVLESASQARAPNTLNRLPVLVSGGVDFNLILTPAAPPGGITLAMSADSVVGVPNSSKKKRNPLMSTAEQQQAMINPISSNTVTTFADSTQRRVPFVPATGRNGAAGGGSVAAVCKGKGWIILRRDQSIGIWDLGVKDAAPRDVAPESAASPPRWSKLLEMELRVNSNLTSVAISPDGRFLAASDLYETKLFSLRERSSGELEPHKVKSFSRLFGSDDNVAPGASAICFSPDSSRVVVCSWSGAYVHVVELPASESEDCRLLRSFGQHRRKPGSSNVEESGRQIAGRGVANGANGHASSAKSNDRVERNTSSLIQHAEISSDGAWLSTISSDLQHHIFSLDSLTFERTLPSPHALPSGSSFHTKRAGLLTLVYSDNKVEFWDVESGKEMSTSGPQRKKASDKMVELKVCIQERLMSVREAAIDAIWLADETLLVWGPTWICTARYDEGNAAKTDEMGDVEMEDVQTTPSDWVIRLTHKYQPLLLVENLGEDLIVVERPFYELARSLPPAFHRGARYGA